MTATARGRTLTMIQREIEALLASRSVDDLAPPRRYRWLVLLESALLARPNREPDQIQPLTYEVAGSELVGLLTEIHAPA